MAAVLQFFQRYHAKIAGILHCYDRIIISGTLLGLCHAKGMVSFLTGQGIRVVDYVAFAERFRDVIRANAEQLAKANHLGH